MARSSRSSSPTSRIGDGRARRAWLGTPGRDLRCAHCGRMTRLGAPNTDPMQATVDHVVEVARGSTDPNDQRYWLVACRHCNSSRGARYQQQPAHRTSERW